MNLKNVVSLVTLAAGILICGSHAKANTWNCSVSAQKLEISMNYENDLLTFFFTDSKIRYIGQPTLRHPPLEPLPITHYIFDDSGVPLKFIFDTYSGRPWEACVGANCWECDR